MALINDQPVSDLMDLSRVDFIDVDDDGNTGFLSFPLFHVVILFSLPVVTFLLAFLLVVWKHYRVSSPDRRQYLVSWFRKMLNLVLNLDGPIGYTILLLSALPSPVSAN